MIKVTCLPNYYLFGDLHTAGIIPSTFLLGRHVIPSPSWKRAVDLMFPKQQTKQFCEAPQGFPIWEGVLDSIYEGIFGGGIPIPKKREDILVLLKS